MHNLRRSTDNAGRSLRGVCVVAAGVTLVLGSAGPGMALTRSTVTQGTPATAATAASPPSTTALPTTPALRATATQPDATQPGATRAYPATAAPAAALFGVSALSASDAWAVGYSVTASGGQTALIEHWNGHRWAVAPTPGQGGTGTFSYLNGWPPCRPVTCGRSVTGRTRRRSTRGSSTGTGTLGRRSPVRTAAGAER